MPHTDAPPSSEPTPDDIDITNRTAMIAGVRHGRQLACARLAQLAADAAERDDGLTNHQSYDLKHAMLRAWTALEREDRAGLDLRNARGVTVITSAHLADRLKEGDLRDATVPTGAES